MDYQKRNKIYKLANLMGIVENFENVRREMTKKGKEVLKNQILEDTSGVYKNKIFSKILEKYDEFNKEADSGIDYSEVIDVMSDVYYEKFSDEEIDELIRFMESEVGKKWMKINHEMAPQMAEISIRWNQKSIEAISNIVNRLLEESEDNLDIEDE